MPPDFQTTWSKIHQVEGWLTEGQARRLWQCAQAAPGSQFAEIGSHHGKSAAILTSARSGATLLAVDPWDDPRWGGGSQAFVEFQKTLAAVAGQERIEIFRGLSSEAHQKLGPRLFDFIYVDGAHDFPTVQDDLRSWGARLHPQGFLAIHDTFSSIGVTRAVLVELLGRRQWYYAGRERSLAVFQKKKAPLLAWVLSRLRMIASLTWFARNLVVKLALRRRWPLVAGLLGHPQATDPF